MARFNRNVIEALEPNEVFVFGSNTAGRHGAGAARMAKDRFGAEWGVGQGRTGQSYALPTASYDASRHGAAAFPPLDLDQIKAGLDRLRVDAETDSASAFLLTRIGMGRSGYSEQQIRPLIEAAQLPSNVKPYWEWESGGGGVRLIVAGNRAQMPGVVEPVVTAPAFQIVPSRGGDGFDVLGMRSGGKTMATVASPGDPGWLGNPYVAVDAGGRLTREEVTVKFGELVRQKAQDEQWAEAFRGLRGKRVGYYKPDEEHIHLQEIQRWLDEDVRAPEQPAAVVNPTGQQVADGVQLKLDLEGQQTQEDPKRKAGDLLPWLLAAGGTGLAAYALAQELNRGNPGDQLPAPPLV